MISPRPLFAAIGAAALLGAAGSATAQVGNTGFEDADFFPYVFTYWDQIPPNSPPQVSQIDNTVDDPILVHAGQHSCKLYGQFIGTPNATLVFQDIPAVPGNLYDLSTWSLTYSSDPIVGLGVGFVSIEFYAADLNGFATGPAIEITTHDVATDTTPYDMFTEAAFGAVCPGAAGVARISLGFFQLDNTVTGSVFYDDADLVDQGPNTGIANPSFDTYVPTPDYNPDACCVPGWERPGGNAFINRTFKKTGNSALLMYGQFNGLANTTTVYQDVGVTPGDLVSYSAFAGHVTGDALQGGNVAFANLEFRDVSDNLLTITSIDALTSSSPPDVFLQSTDTATVPATATKARLVLGLFQDADMGSGQDAGAVYFEDTSFESFGPNTGLVNPGFDTFVPDLVTFEPDPTQPLPGWSTFGFNGGVLATPNVGHAKPGVDDKQLAAYIFGQFPGDNSANTTVVYQDLPANPGEQVQVDAQVKQNSVDVLGPDNSLTAAISWRDGSDVEIGVDATVALTSVSPSDVFFPTSVSGTAPAGTVTARIAFVYTQVNEGGGAALIDDVTVAITPPPPCPGDLDGDGSTGVLDFAILAPNFGTSGHTPFTDGDLDGDGDVDILDFAIFAPAFGCTP
jgi:hypothetical protein